MGFIKGDTRSVDYSSHDFEIRLHVFDVGPSRFPETALLSLLQTLLDIKGHSGLERKGLQFLLPGGPEGGTLFSPFAVCVGR